MSSALQRLTPRAPVQRDLLSNQIAVSLRRDILLGVIRPGTKLSQQQLCEQFGTSRMPVRDALRTLTHEGLLVTDSAQHTIVAPLSRQDLLDAYELEGVIAGMAATRASRHAAKEDLDRLRDYHDAMIESHRTSRFEAMADLNWNFHRHINRLSQSRKILSALRAVSVDLPREFLVELPDWAQKSNDDHLAILDAMTSKRHRRVGKLMTDHIVDSGRGLLGYLEREGLQLD